MSGFFFVAAGTVGVRRIFFLRYLAAHLGGHTKHHRTIGDYCTLGHQRTCANDAVSADHCAVENDGTHTHQRIVADGAAVENGAVADGAVVAYHQRKFLINVENAVILNIGTVTYNNGRVLGADHRTEKDAALCSDGNIA